jgi:hypothetical protein
MTALTFIADLKEFLEYEASVPGLSNVDITNAANDAKFRSFASKYLKIFTAKALCYFVEASTFNTVVNQSVYSIEDASIPMASIRWALIDGEPLYDSEGSMATTGLQELVSNKLVNSAASKPTRLGLINKEQIGLYPKPDNVYGITLIGFGLQEDLTSGASLVRVPSRLQDYAVRFCAGMILEKRGSGTNLERANYLIKTGEEGAMNYANEVLTALLLSSQYGGDTDRIVSTYGF